MKKYLSIVIGVVIAASIAGTVSAQRICTIERGRPPVCTDGGGGGGSGVCGAGHPVPWTGNGTTNSNGDEIGWCNTGRMDGEGHYLGYMTRSGCETVCGGLKKASSLVSSAVSAVNSRASGVSVPFTASANSYRSTVSALSSAPTARPTATPFSSAFMRDTLAAARLASVSAPTRTPSASAPASIAPGAFGVVSAPATAVSGTAWMPGYMSAMMTAMANRRATPSIVGQRSCSPEGYPKVNINVQVVGAVGNSRAFANGQFIAGQDRGSDRTPFNWSAGTLVDLTPVSVSGQGYYGPVMNSVQVSVIDDGSPAMTVRPQTITVQACQLTCANITNRSQRMLAELRGRRIPLPESWQEVNRAFANMCNTNVGENQDSAGVWQAVKCEWVPVSPSGAGTPSDISTEPHGCRTVRS